MPWRRSRRPSQPAGGRRLTYAWSMIFSENRYPLFGIMLWRRERAMRTVIVWIAALVLCGLGRAAPAQDMMRHVDLGSPDMVAAEMTRADVERMLAARSEERRVGEGGRARG